MLTFSIDNNDIRITIPSLIIKGTVGMKCAFIFSDEWANYSRTAVFKSKAATKTVLLDDSNICIVPWEVLVSVGNLTVGIYGTYNGSVTPTIYANAGEIRNGTDVLDDPGVAPTPSIYTQIIEHVDGVLVSANDARDKSIEASIVSDQKAILAASSASSALSNANSASLHDESASQSKNTAANAADDATQASIAALDQAQKAEQYATQAQAVLSSFPIRYYKTSIGAMNAITGMKEGDLCYVIDLVQSITTLYTYDTADLDSDNVNPEWQLIGVMQFEVMSRTDLLSILQLATVALTGKYSDLTDKPNRYESFAVVEPVDISVAWDYTVSDKIKVILTADATLSISNVTNGSIGMVEVYGGFNLEVTGGKSADWDYIELNEGQHWIYMFIYNGTTYSWTRTVCTDE